MRSSNGITTPGAFIPDAFENDVVSRMTARHSAQRVTYGSSPATVATGLASRSAAEQRPRFLALAAERVELGRVGHRAHSDKRSAPGVPALSSGEQFAFIDERSSQWRTSEACVWPS